MTRAPATGSALALAHAESEHRRYQMLLRQSYGAFAEKVFLTLCPGEPFLPNWHIDLLCDWLERVRRGEVRRLIINLPPRGPKSMLVSVALPAFMLGHRPDRRIITAS